MRIFVNVVIGMGCVLIFSWILGSGARMTRSRPQGQLTACKSNLKNIGTACEMYSTDFGGNYPATISKLTPNYLKTIPTCASAGVDTYTETYFGYNRAKVHNYTFYCHGENHKSANEAPDYPQYNSTQGLVTLGPVGIQPPA